ncbi:hypothetical protein N2152v2_010740 [Parachlorella kessleri]
MSSGVFDGWSVSQLKEYIEENGGSSKHLLEKQDLIGECERLSREVEAKVLKNPTSAPAYPPAGPTDGPSRYPSTTPGAADGSSKYPSAGPGDGGNGDSKYPSMYSGGGGSTSSGPSGGDTSRYPSAFGGAPSGARGPYEQDLAPFGSYPAYPPAPGGAPAAPSYPYGPPQYPSAGGGGAPGYPSAYPPAGPPAAANGSSSGGSYYPGASQPAGPSAYPPMPGGGVPSYPGYPLGPSPQPSAAYPPGPSPQPSSGYPPGPSPQPSSAYPPGPAPQASSAYPGYPASPYGHGKAESHHNGGGGGSHASAYPGSQPAGPPKDTRPGQAAGSAYSGSVPPAMPPASGKKKALLCGCNYFGTSAQLNGCINDAKCMEYLLRTKFGFGEHILLMVDNHTDPLRRPTRYNMMQGMAWLMAGLRPGDSLFFHFSGHGSQQRDYSGEESDGMNETICPCDFKQAGQIVDDELNRILVNPIPTGVKLHAVVDACHSGSAFDLPFHATVAGGYSHWQSEYRGYMRSNKGTAGGFCVQFGAAKDSQVAADTAAMSGTGVSTGAATYSFIQAIEHRSGSITYGALLMAMHNTLMAATGGGGGMGGGMAGGGSLNALLGSLLGGSTSGFRGQEPVLSCNYAFDLNYKFEL